MERKTPDYYIRPAVASRAGSMTSQAGPGADTNVALDHGDAATGEPKKPDEPVTFNGSSPEVRSEHGTVRVIGLGPVISLTPTAAGRLSHSLLRGAREATATPTERSTASSDRSRGLPGGGGRERG